MYDQEVRSPYLIAFLIDMYEEKCLRGYDQQEDIDALAQKVLLLCNLMLTKFDVIRQKYWEYVAANFKIKYGKIQENGKISQVSSV